MMHAARDAAQDSESRPKVIAVTVLTSLEDGDLEMVGQGWPAADQALKLATLAKVAGMDGVVCSAHEIAAIRAACGSDFQLIVPGIRPAGADLADQRRVMTPRKALDAGADILVIGRPITAARDPGEAARAISAELQPL